jgi:hypothetical protein
MDRDARVVRSAHACAIMSGTGFSFGGRGGGGKPLNHHHHHHSPAGPPAKQHRWAPCIYAICIHVTPGNMCRPLSPATAVGAPTWPMRPSRRLRGPSVLWVHDQPNHGARVFPHSQRPRSLSTLSCRQAGRLHAPAHTVALARRGLTPATAPRRGLPLPPPARSTITPARARMLFFFFFFFF